MPKPHRNDRCPCGSGHKYKHCHGRSDTEAGKDPLARRLGDLSVEAVQTLERFATRSFGLDGLALAWADFWDAEPEEVNSTDSEELVEDIFGDPFIELFLPWYVLLWTLPPSPEAGVDDNQVPTIASRYLSQHGRRLRPDLRAFIETAQHEPLAFWEVQEVWPERGLLLRELVLGREVTVHDISASRSLRRWDIVLAQVVGVDDVYVFMGLAPYALSSAQGELIQPLIDTMRKKQLQRPEELLDWDMEILDAYRDAHDAIAGAPPPHIVNSDGEELVMTRMTYQFQPADRDAIAATLAKLPNMAAHTDSAPDALGFTWYAAKTKHLFGFGDKPTRGHLTLALTELTAETNSTERAIALRGLIESALGTMVRLTENDASPLDMNALNRAAMLRGAEPSPEERPPELVALEQQFMATAILKWADERIPVLGGKSPRQAVKNVKGRAAVAQLVKEYENGLSRHHGDTYRATFDELRASLGLTAS